MTILSKNQFILPGAGRFEIFGYQPENVSKNKWGYLYIIGGINKPISFSDPNFYLLNSIASILKKEYYANYYENSVSSLEHALRKINGVISASEYRHDLEILIIIIQDNRITFTKIGGIKILLIRNSKLFNLNQLSKKEDEQDKNTLFKNIIRGKIQEKDRLIIITKRARNLLKNEFFIARLIKRSFSQIEDFIKRNINNTKKEPGIALLQITIEKFIDSNFQTKIINKENNEKNNIYYSNSDTSQLDSFYNENSHKKFNSPKNIINKLLNFKHYFKLQSTSESLKSITSEKHKNKTIKTLYKLSIIIIKFSKKFKYYTITYIIKFKQALITKKIFKSEIYLKPKKLPFLKTKYKLITIISFIIMLIVILILIFGGNNKQTIKPDIKEINILNSSLGVAIKEIIELDKLSFIVKGIVISENNIIGYNYTEAYAINGYSDSELLFTNSSISKPFEKAVKLNDKNIVFISKSDNLDTKKIIIYNIDDKSFITEEIDWPISGDIIDIESFNDNLYLLGENNIIKYTYKNKAFSNSQKWIKVSENQEKLINPLSIAIDGSIFILDNLGNISEFLKGKKIDEIANLGLVSNNSKIVTHPDWNYIYFFDPLSSKITIINKLTSEIEYNFKDPFLTGIKYIAPKNNESSILILDNKGIYEIDLNKINLSF